mmetsp:Transcript_11279/g.35325  ORF Transcript_11279/g.35325 Transcript_11279/m.35325 type:complete len:244 (+) Transcript_11279:584-1315(+)
MWRARPTASPSSCWRVRVRHPCIRPCGSPQAPYASTTGRGSGSLCAWTSVSASAGPSPTSSKALSTDLPSGSSDSDGGSVSRFCGSSATPTAWTALRLTRKASHPWSGSFAWWTTERPPTTRPPSCRPWGQPSSRSAWQTTPLRPVAQVFHLRDQDRSPRRRRRRGRRPDRSLLPRLMWPLLQRRPNLRTLRSTGSHAGRVRERRHRRVELSRCHPPSSTLGASSPGRTSPTSPRPPASSTLS